MILFFRIFQFLSPTSNLWWFLFLFFVSFSFICYIFRATKHLTHFRVNLHLPPLERHTPHTRCLWFHVITNNYNVGWLSCTWFYFRCFWGKIWEVIVCAFSLRRNTVQYFTTHTHTHTLEIDFYGMRKNGEENLKKTSNKQQTKEKYF